jgi:membrane-associated phospholipid phosphatase
VALSLTRLDVMLAALLLLFGLAQLPEGTDVQTAAPAEVATPTAANIFEPADIPDASDRAADGALLIDPQGENHTQSEDRTRADQQEEPRDEKPPTPPHTGLRALVDGLRLDIKNLPSRPNLYLALIGGGAALGVHPFDQSFNIRLRSHYDVVNDVFAPAKYLGDTPEQIALSLGTYAVGRIFDEPKVSHVGMDLLRAQAISELLVQPLKFATHRRRPDGSNDLSFPSGHAAATFAAATVIERHLGWKKAVLAYGAASYVAASRLHDNVHYLSDVVFGAAVGTIAGRTVTAHGREVWTLQPVFVPGGAAVLLMRVP